LLSNAISPTIGAPGQIVKDTLGPVCYHRDPQPAADDQEETIPRFALCDDHIPRSHMHRFQMLG